jgi:hypothetical protein
MQSTKTQYGQSLIDIALQMLGDEERLFELCDLNDAGITECIEAGRDVIAPDFDVTKKQIVNTLKATNPASFVCEEPVETILEGIGYWAIEFDFKVS